ncbi:hypothetical protein JD969_06060 [Planctomycetota bacterium]|nr:hypothetical protein JD969_06060 [Planctomycetota bacterium]
MRHLLLIGLLVGCIVLTLGCTTSHGIEKYDAKYTHALAEDKASTGIVNITILHAGNFDHSGMFGSHHAKMAMRIAGKADEMTERDNRPTYEQARTMKAFEETITEALCERADAEVSSLLNFQQAKPMISSTNELHTSQFMQRYRLDTAIDVTLELTKQTMGPMGSKHVVKGTWRLLDPDAQQRLVIHTTTPIAEGTEIADTRDAEYQSYYLDAINEAVNEFSIFLHEALSPKSENPLAELVPVE